MSYSLAKQIHDRRYNKAVDSYKKAVAKGQVEESVESCRALSAKMWDRLQSDRTEKNRILYNWASNVCLGSRIVLENFRPHL